LGWKSNGIILPRQRRAPISYLPSPIFGLALGGQIVNFLGLNPAQEPGEAAAVGEIAVMEEEPFFVCVRVFVNMVEPPGIERAGATDEAVDFVSFGKEKLGEVRTVLAGDAGDESLSHCGGVNFEL
jgi:hypothetical protein